MGALADRQCNTLQHKREEAQRVPETHQSSHISGRKEQVAKSSSCQGEAVGEKKL